MYWLECVVIKQCWDLKDATMKAVKAVIFSLKIWIGIMSCWFPVENSTSKEKSIEKCSGTLGNRPFVSYNLLQKLYSGNFFQLREKGNLLKIVFSFSVFSLLKILSRKQITETCEQVMVRWIINKVRNEVSTIHQGEMFKFGCKLT